MTDVQDCAGKAAGKARKYVGKISSKLVRNIKKEDRWSEQQGFIPPAHPLQQQHPSIRARSSTDLTVQDSSDQSAGEDVFEDGPLEKVPLNTPPRHLLAILGCETSSLLFHLSPCLLGLLSIFGVLSLPGSRLMLTTCKLLQVGKDGNLRALVADTGSCLWAAWQNGAMERFSYNGKLLARKVGCCRYPAPVLVSSIIDRFVVQRFRKCIIPAVTDPCLACMGTYIDFQVAETWEFQATRKQAKVSASRLRLSVLCAGSWE